MLTVAAMPLVLFDATCRVYRRPGLAWAAVFFGGGDGGGDTDRGPRRQIRQVARPRL